MTVFDFSGPSPVRSAAPTAPQYDPISSVLPDLELSGVRASSSVYTYFLTSSTRRFCARPVSAVFGATGFVSPNPLVVSRAAGMPNVCTR